MKLRAVIFDLYQTVLEVGPPPVDRDARWTALACEALGAAPRLSIARFMADCDRVIAREHSVARAAGIPFPEIFWPDITLEVWPELALLPAPARDEFLLRQQTLFRTVRLMRGAAEVLRLVRDRGIPAGIASNAQPYTLHELDRALADGGLLPEFFAPELCFWSFAHGFSKPDPHVFRLLTARVRARGISPAETLMIGDRLDNDIAPARVHGWQTWHLTAASGGERGGDWAECGKFISAHT
jgi:FMN phosphatase YigB (HAD superfamily)